MNFSIKQLRAFLILSEADSFTQAARRFNLSQPAFSTLIASLEEEIGYRLFDRDTRRVSLNADGIHFLDLARKIVQSHDDAIGEIKTRAASNHSDITLAALPSLAVEWLPEILVKYSKAAPQSKVKLIDTQWDRCLKSLLDGQADMALTAGQPSLSTFNSILLFSDKFFLLCHRDHPLAQQSSVSLSQLGDYPFIGFSVGTSIRQYTDKLCENLAMNLDYHLEVRQLTTMMGLIAANYGISITTGLTLFQFNHKDIVILPFDDLALERAIYLVTQKGRQLAPRVASFAEFITCQAHMFATGRRSTCAGFKPQA
ncbi:LysR family transcriptional regulator [Kosakonia oryzae]|uniref:DNA-binding transcriptional regulator, LysR family n=1 Tax=Kosakonia oryzae TaxID=497725 RepID=A0AA94H134_9ENTR|nr:LysR family transcriptional regulator [Kosakonia oryzae]ANI83695.1 LysR family transcriptional regulator [Kosakonia oryzae]SFB80069.1 DNA-binding transcriptional regulator, LysR family [Kosakonia oryzae]